MRHGISVFLDAPLDALARRIAAVGTDSRPLLEYDSGEGDAYSKVYDTGFEYYYFLSTSEL